MMAPVEETSTVLCEDQHGEEGRGPLAHSELLGVSSVTTMASRSTTWKDDSVAGRPACCTVMVWTWPLPAMTGEE